MLLENYEVEADGVRFAISQQLKQIVGIEEDFWFSFSGVNCEDIPFEVLSIPFILNIAPVVWISGCKLSIQSMDSQLKDSLCTLKSVFEQMYPSVCWDGEIICNSTTVKDRKVEITDCRPVSVVLFSGGLDSIATSFNHAEEKQALLSIRGADIGLNDDAGWKKVKEGTEKYALEHGFTNYYVESNFVKLFSSMKLKKYPQIPNWWAYVQHGMGLTSFMAIPAFLENAKIGYIGSTHTDAFKDKPWGSKPEIDNNIFWSNFSVVHDCYEYTRQQKSNLIVNVIKSRNLKPPVLRVCYSSDGGGNCCLCEKCSRTISSLWVQGEDHTNYGFYIEQSKVIKNVRLKFLFYGFKFFDNEVYQWNDIVQHGRTFSSKDKLVNDYLNWLSKFDFERYKNKYNIYFMFRQKLREIPVVRFCYKSLKKIFER
ncbi:hypothetical protein [Vibrio sp. DNB22_19_1]